MKEVIPKMPPPAFDTYHIDRWVSYGNTQSSAAVFSFDGKRTELACGLILHSYQLGVPFLSCRFKIRILVEHPRNAPVNISISISHKKSILFIAGKKCYNTHILFRGDGRETNLIDLTGLPLRTRCR